MTYTVDDSSPWRNIMSSLTAWRFARACRRTMMELAGSFQWRLIHTVVCLCLWGVGEMTEEGIAAVAILPSTTVGANMMIMYTGYLWRRVLWQAFLEWMWGIMVFKIQTWNHKVHFHKIFSQETVTFHKNLLTIPCEKIKLWCYVNFFVRILNTINIFMAKL